MNTEIHNDIKVITSILPALTAPTVDANGTGVDLKGYESAELLVHLGNSLDTLSGSVYISLEIEESDNDSDYTDVAEKDLVGAVAGTTVGQFALVDAPTEDSAVFGVGYKGSKRYIRPVVNVTGTHTNGTPLSACVVLSNARHQPAGVTQAP